MSFDCETLLDFADVDVADCRWVDGTQLTASVSGSLGLLPGGNVTMNAGVVKSACDGYRCECLTFANASSTTAEPPEEPLIPSAVLQGPELFSVCEAGGLKVTSDQSTGGGGRAMTYSWNATVPRGEAAAANATAVAAALDTLATAAARAIETFEATSEEMATVSAAFSAVELALTLRISLGALRNQTSLSSRCRPRLSRTFRSAAHIGKSS